MKYTLDINEMSWFIWRQFYRTRMKTLLGNMNKTQEILCQCKTERDIDNLFDDLLPIFSKIKDEYYKMFGRKKRDNFINN